MRDAFTISAIVCLENNCELRRNKKMTKKKKKRRRSSSRTIRSRTTITTTTTTRNRSYIIEEGGVVAGSNYAIGQYEQHVIFLLALLLLRLFARNFRRRSNDLFDRREL